jgi:integrase
MYKREGSPYWFASFTDANGKRNRQSTGCTDRREAAAVEAKWKLEAHRAKTWDEKPPLSFESLAVLYLQQGQEARERFAIKALRKHLGGLIMDKCKPADILGYKAARASEGASPATVNRELTTLIAAINFANKEHGYSLPNPASGRKHGNLDKRVRWLTREEARRLLEACAESQSPYVYLWTYLALNTGCRKQELLGLTWDRVDLVNRLIVLDAKDTKGKKRRSIPMSEGVWRMLEMVEYYRKSDPTSKYVIGGHKRIGDIKKAFANACERAGIKDFRPHDCRHTTAAWLVTAGAPLSAVRDLLGHSSITMTERYAHLSPDSVRKAVSVLDEVIA